MWPTFANTLPKWILKLFGHYCQLIIWPKNRACFCIIFYLLLVNYSSMLGLILMKQSYHLVTLLSIHFHSFINNIFSVCHSVLQHTTTLSHSSTLLPIQRLLTLFYTFTPRLWVCLSLFGLRLSVCRLTGVCISVFVNPFRPCVCLCVCAWHVIWGIQSHKVTSGLNGYKATFSLKVREGER